MKKVYSPNKNEIDYALQIVARSEKSIMLTSSRYAVTQHGTFIDKGNISTPKSLCRPTCYITVYSDTLASAKYCLSDMSMYDKQEIEKAGFIPVSPDELPRYFDNFKTIIYYENQE